jgi:uncharacterized protein YdhG (YjbR/CyaY superfamily)
MPTAQPDPRQIRQRIDKYLAAQSPDSRRVLKTLRTTIRAAAPKAVEHFSYGIPGFRLDGKTLIWYAGWKSHSSLYPVTASIKRANAAQLKKYKLGKGTLQLPLDEALPLALVRKIVRARVREVRAG